MCFSVTCIGYGCPNQPGTWEEYDNPNVYDLPAPGASVMCCCGFCAENCNYYCSSVYNPGISCWTDCCGLTGSCRPVGCLPTPGSGVSLGTDGVLPITPQDAQAYDGSDYLEPITSPSCAANSIDPLGLGNLNAYGDVACAGANLQKICKPGKYCNNGPAPYFGPSGGGSGGSVGGSSGSGTAKQNPCCKKQVNALTSLSGQLANLGTSLTRLLNPTKSGTTTIASSTLPIGISSSSLLLVLVVIGGLMLFLAFSKGE